MKKLAVFLGGSLAFGAASLGVAHWAGLPETWLQGGAAFGLTVVPAILTMAWGVFTYRSAPDLQLLAALGGSGIRMAVVLGGGYLLTATRPQYFDRLFWAWLIWFYLGMLAFEITLLVRHEPKPNGSPQT